MILVRISSLMGLDTKSMQHSVAITEALHNIENTEAFYQFLEDKKSSIEYETKPERLLTLSRMYKKLQEKAKLPNDQARQFSKNLAHKVEQSRNIIEEKSIDFSMLAVDGEKFFTQKELNALQGIGSIIYIIEASKNHTLEDNLMALFLSKFTKQSKYTSLPGTRVKLKGMGWD